MDDDDASASDGPEPTGETVREGGGELGPRTTPTRVEERRLERGDAVGRYLVLDIVGEGGMGVVYAAYDPELDRKVAIKLLQARSVGSGSRGDQAWLVREAQAMAKVQHPNVLAVHDVGTLPGDRVFVAMELVDGATLRQWLRASKRTWREVVPVLRAAGAGLAAAHAAGLVHRDFKPDNVLVGQDGRARVMDFGLARLRDEHFEPTPASRDSDVSIASKSPLSASLTVAGTVAGTPAYMAPEIHAGAAADARSDQFAFGVALYEALYRARPYDKADLATIGAQPVPRPPPEAADVPPRLARVAQRAIALAPGDRYPTMDALLADLAEEPRAARRAWLGGGAAVLGIGGVIAALVATRAPSAAQCRGAAERLTGVWDTTVQARVRGAFDATKSPLAGAAYDTVARELDGYASAWTDASTESCQATRVRREQPEDAMALRQTCLDEQREELRALTALFGQADAVLVEKASRAAAALDPVARCANVAALRAPGTPPAEMQVRLDGVRVQLASAKAAFIAGRTEPALTGATAAVEAATAIGWAPVLGEAQLLRGAALQQAGKATEAAAAYAEATWAGLRGRQDDLAARAALAAAQETAEGLGKDAEARIWLGLGQATAGHGGDRELDVQRLEVAGVVAGARGDQLAAVTAHEQALAAAAALGDPATTGRVEGILAATLAKSGDYAKAAPHYERALALREAAAGKDHPDVALLLTSLGACYDHAGDAPRARTAFARALAIREAAFGSTSPRLLATLNNLADLQRRHGELAEATAVIDRAFAIAAAAPGSAHPLYHTVATTRGEILLASGKLTEARAALDEVIALEEPVKSPGLAETLASRAEVALAESAYADAAALDARAIEALEAAGGKDAPDLWRPLAGLARARAGLHDAPGARAAATRALTIGRAAQISEAELAPARALAAD